MSARQSQRVLIDVPVQLTLRADSRTLPARALDLSEGGMRLSADHPLPVGDEVTCDLELDSERAALRGRVRWSKPLFAQPAAAGSSPPPAGAGVGVQFEELSDEQLGLIRRWLAHNSEHSEVVLLHVPGAPEPLRARGCVTADGLQLIAALPQLSPGAELEFQLGEHGSRRIARVERVDVRAGSECGQVELAVRLQPSAAARSRRNLVYGLGAVDPDDVPDVLPPPARVPQFAAGAPIDGSHAPLARIGESTHLETMEIPKTATKRVATGSLLVMATAGALIWLSNLVQDRPSHTQSETVTSAARAQLTTTAPKAPPPEPEPEPEPALTPTPDPQPATPPQPSAATTPIPEEARLPALNSFGSKSEIFVPMQGSLAGLRSTQWTDPLAVVLDLPDAHIDAPELLQGLRGGGVRRVRLDETRPVPRLQIFLNTVAARFAARSVPHGLLVVLEHDLQPMPQ